MKTEDVSESNKCDTTIDFAQYTVLKMSDQGNDKGYFRHKINLYAVLPTTCK